MNDHNPQASTIDQSQGDDSDREDRLGHVLLAIGQARDHGDLQLVRDILQHHPEYRAELEEFLDLESEFLNLNPDFKFDDLPRLPDDPQLQEKYEGLDTPVAEGGYGRVFQARDRVLGRLVAIKVFKPDLRNTSALIRFLDEPQVASQLDHPGVAPVYEFGRTEDGRPYVVMKWVDGQTLSDLLHDQRSEVERPRLLEIFKQVCQTLAYAHRMRGVLHRDLKPSNIMVGAFGEVLVMDWGLSKVVLSDDDELGDGRRIPVETTRSRDPELVTQAGAKIGTTPYMSPEQARGEINRITARSDVFGLGAILCEILTGHPPYWDEDLAEKMRQYRMADKAGDDSAADAARQAVRKYQAKMAEEADLKSAHRRLDACGADSELIALTKTCLEVDPAARPADAGKVAEAITAYLDGLQAKLQQREVESAALKSRQEAEVAALNSRRQLETARLRTRLFVALAAIVLLLGIGGTGLAGWYYQFERDARRTEADARQAEENMRRAKAEAEKQLLSREGQKGLDSVFGFLRYDKIDDAEKDLAKVSGLLAHGGPDELLQKVEDAQRHLKFVRESERIRQRLGDPVARMQPEDTGISFAWMRPRNTSALVAEMQIEDTGNGFAYGRAFAGYGIDVNEPDQAARIIRESPIRTHLLAALDHWVEIVNYPGSGSHLNFLNIARKAISSDDKWGQEFHDPKIRRNREKLVQLASRTEPGEHSAAEIEGLARALMRFGADAESLLRRKLNERPKPNELHSDFWLNLLLAQQLQSKALAARSDAERRQFAEEAIRFVSAALAIRPNSQSARHILSRLLVVCRRPDEAIENFQREIETASGEAGSDFNGPVRLQITKARYYLAIALLIKRDMEKNTTEREKLRQQAENVCEEGERLAPPSLKPQMAALLKQVRQLGAGQ